MLKYYRCIQEMHRFFYILIQEGVRTTKVRDFEVKNRIGESDKYRVYLGEKADGSSVVLKVAKTFEDGDVLAFEAGKFNTMKTVEAEIRRFQNPTKENDSHYDWLFAKLEASFIEQSQGGRRINVYSLPDVDFDKLIPLSKLMAKIEVDAKTSAWILGRIFKLYGFFELIAVANDQSTIEYPVFSIGDYLIEPEKHRVIFYNFPEKNVDVVANDYVKEIAKTFLEWAVIEEEDKAYRELLENLARDGSMTFEAAHKMMYAVIEELWGRKYHTFTYRDKGTLIWKNLKED